jgi:pimeloyl-ACP methyl ester carboxylesterase
VPELAYDRRGSGEPLVLLHGLGSRRRAWRPVVELVSRSREVLAVDLPGFGDSPSDSSGTRLTVADYADRLQLFFTEVGVEVPHVAGNSLGGGVALELGRRRAVRSVTLFSPIGFWGRPGKAWCRRALGAGYELGRRLPEGMQTVAVTRLFLFVYSFGRPFKVSAEEVLDAAQSGREAPGFLDALTYGLDYRFSEPEALRQIPLTVAWGRRDVLCWYWTQSRRARQMLPWARHVTLARCGHVPFYDDPELCARVLLEGSTRGRPRSAGARAALRPRLGHGRDGP